VEFPSLHLCLSFVQFIMLILYLMCKLGFHITTLIVPVPQKDDLYISIEINISEKNLCYEVGVNM
jgi:hypothetical protein